VPFGLCGEVDETVKAAWTNPAEFGGGLLVRFFAMSNHPMVTHHIPKVLARARRQIKNPPAR